MVGLFPGGNPIDPRDLTGENALDRGAQMHVGLSVLAMSAWWYGVGIGGVALLFVAMIFRERGRFRQRLREYLGTHPPMPEDEFLARSGIPAEGSRVALLVRKGVAEAMGIPPANLHPTDSLQYLCGFGFGDVDFADILFLVGKALGVRVSVKSWKALFADARKADLITLGDLARFVDGNWGGLVSAKNPVAR